LPPSRRWLHGASWRARHRLLWKQPVQVRPTPWRASPRRGSHRQRTSRTPYDRRAGGRGQPLSDHPSASIRNAIDRYLDAVLDLTVRVCRIPAPSFAEEERSAFAREHFAALGLNTWIDAAGSACAL